MRSGERECRRGVGERSQRRSRDKGVPGSSVAQTDWASGEGHREQEGSPREDPHDLSLTRCVSRISCIVFLSSPASLSLSLSCSPVHSRFDSGRETQQSLHKLAAYASKRRRRSIAANEFDWTHCADTGSRSAHTAVKGNCKHTVLLLLSCLPGDRTATTAAAAAATRLLYDGEETVTLAWQQQSRPAARELGERRRRLLDCQKGEERERVSSLI